MVFHPHSVLKKLLSDKMPVSSGVFHQWLPWYFIACFVNSAIAFINSLKLPFFGFFNVHIFVVNIKAYL